MNIPLSISISPRAPLRRVSRALLACIAAAALPRTAAAQASLSPRLQVVLRGPGMEAPPQWQFQPRRPPVDISRGPGGALYLSTRGGVLVVDAAAEPRWVAQPSGERELAAAPGLMGDTLVVGYWREWSLYGTAGEYRSCRRFADVHNEFAVQVFPTRLLPGGLVIGELSPPFPGTLGRRLVVSREQTVLRTLYVLPLDPQLPEVPFPWGGGGWLPSQHVIP